MDALIGAREVTLTKSNSSLHQRGTDDMRLTPSNHRERRGIFSPFAGFNKVAESKRTVGEISINYAEELLVVFLENVMTPVQGERA